MKHPLIPLLAVVALTASHASAATIYSQDFNSFATGTANPDGWWSFHGPGSVTATFTVQPSGPGNSQALEFDVDSSGAFGTDWYFYAGMGRSDLIAAGILPADVTVSLDLASHSAATPTAITLAFAQYSGQTEVWKVTFNPTLTTDGTFTHVNLNLAQGTQTGSWNPTLPIGLNSLSFNSEFFGFGNDRIFLDNFQVNVIPEPSAFALFGMAGLFLLRRTLSC